MNIKQFVAIAITAVGTGAALAQINPISGTDITNHSLQSSRSRAEVLAELEIWQQSGLAELERRGDPNVFSEPYRQASARYAALRASPAFAARVQGLSRTGG